MARTSGSTVTPIQRSFTSGELSPALRVRADLSKYATGLDTCKNFIVRAQGGVSSRAGMRFIGEIDDSTKRARLIEFSFNTEQTYMLVFEELKIQVIKDGAFVMDGASRFEVATPYTEEQLPFVGFTQSADVMTLVHPAHDPRNLSRLDHDDWTLSVISFAPTTTIPTSLVATAVGTGGGTYDKTYQYVVTAIGEDDAESLASATVSITLGSLSVTRGVTLTWDAVVGAQYYNIYKSDSVNTEVYGSIGESKTEEYTDFNIAPDNSKSPPEERTPFAAANDKPSAVNYYQQRQVFANTTNRPQTLYTTQTSNYSSLRTSSPTRASDAVTLTIAARQVNEIRHIIALDSLIMMTSGGEWLVTEGQDEVLAPDTVGVKIQSYNGASWVPPVIINDTVVFVQEKGARIRDLGYTFSSDKYKGNDLSIMSEHLFENKEIKEMSYASEPYGILWCVRDDGVLLGMTYQKEQEVWGWHKHDTQGSFESIGIITEDRRDAPYVIVNRVVGGVNKRYVERMEPREELVPADCFYVDSGLTYSGTAATTITGLDHLEGMDVSVLADGNVVKGLTVESGSITIPDASTKVHVGLSYEPRVCTVAIDSADGNIRGASKSVSEVKVLVNATRGGWVGPKGNDDLLIEVKPRTVADGYDTIALREQELRVNISADWSEDGQVCIVQRDPLPMTILAIIPETDIGG
jgi:hypothetical protein